MKKILSLLVISAALLILNSVPYAKVAAAESPRRVEINAKRYSFDPSVITLKKGEPVVLVVKSSDVAHGLRFRDLGVEVKVPKGGQGEVRFTPDKTGDFIGHCSVFCGEGHGTMTLTFHVVS
jgi:cytochrome c oxidase subunit 2